MKCLYMLPAICLLFTHLVETCMSALAAVFQRLNSAVHQIKLITIQQIHAMKITVIEFPVDSAIHYWNDRGQVSGSVLESQVVTCDPRVGTCKIHLATH